MDFYGMRFEYDGVSSRLYDLMIASVSKSRNLSVSGKASIVTMHNRRPAADYYMNTRWDKGNLSFDMEFVREYPLSPSEQRAVTKWLFHTPGYRHLYFEYLDDEQAEWFDMVDGVPIRYYLNCILTEPEKIEGNGGVCGYRCKAICDAPWAWSDDISVTVDDITEPVSESLLIEAGWEGYIDDEDNIGTFVIMYVVVDQTGWSATHIDSVEMFGENISTYSEADRISIAVMTPVERDGSGRITDILSPEDFGRYALGLIYGDEDTRGLLLCDVIDSQTTAPDVQTAVTSAYQSARDYQPLDTVYVDDRSINVYIDSDANEYVYPVVAVMTAGDEFSLWNSTDDASRVTGFTDVNENETIVIDGQTNYVAGVVPNRYGNFTSPNFPRLVDGDNELHVRGNIKSIKITWKNRRYI